MFLTLQNLTLIKNHKKLLNNLSLEIKKNEIFAIVGKNGAGKSTLAYTLMGLPEYKPTEGKIFLEGEDITNLSITERAKRGMTLLWQEPARFEGITVREYMAKTLKSDDENKFKEALELVNLDYHKYINRFVDHSLSGGERKRIELATIYLMNPKLLILDEPDSGIDIEAINNIFKMMELLKEKGATILLITHSEAVLEKADRGALICCGSIYMETTKIEDLKNYFASKCPKCDVSL